MPADDRAGPGKAPDAFRTISEVAEDLDLPQHVLRFWETRFTHIKPMKRGGGRRYYRPEDIDLLRGIRILLYAEGFTIRGVQRLLKEKGVAFVTGVARTGSSQAVPAPAATPAATAAIVPVDPDETFDDIEPSGSVEDEVELKAKNAAEAEGSFESREAESPFSPSPKPLPNMSAAPAPRPANAAAPRIAAAGRRRLERILDDLIETRRLLDFPR